METSSLLLELYGRIPPLARRAVDGLNQEQLCARPTPDANSIAWLIWHLTRVHDHHVSELMGEQQLWESGTFAASLSLPADPDNTGYGHSRDDVATIQPTSPAVLLAYLDAVNERVRGFLEGVSQSDLDRVVDRRWDPPVTMGVRLVSVADDSLQHVGQAGYLRGLLGL